MNPLILLIAGLFLLSKINATAAPKAPPINPPVVGGGVKIPGPTGIGGSGVTAKDLLDIAKYGKTLWDEYSDSDKDTASNDPNSDNWDGTDYTDTSYVYPQIG